MERFDHSSGDEEGLMDFVMKKDISKGNQAGSGPGGQNKMVMQRSMLGMGSLGMKLGGGSSGMLMNKFK